MARWIALFVLISLGACGPRWPGTMFPKQVEVERTLYSDASSGLREGCEVIVVELVERSAMRLSGMSASGADGWTASPIPEDEKPVAALSVLGGCGTDEARPLGDISGALRRPGAWYKVVNGGEGLAVIVPRAKLAGWYYIG
ncbi:MAG: hypothetical protein ACO1O3_21910 [Sphingobium sp.]